MGRRVCHTPGFEVTLFEVLRSTEKTPISAHALFVVQGSISCQEILFFQLPSKPHVFEHLNTLVPCQNIVNDTVRYACRTWTRRALWYRGRTRELHFPLIVALTVVVRRYWERLPILLEMANNIFMELENIA